MNRTQLVQQIRTKQNYLCVGLDTDITKIPNHLLDTADPVFEFNKAIIDATKDYCVSYKINTAFYESQGMKGWESMEKTLYCIPEKRLYEKVLEKVASWGTPENLMFVVGATRANDLEHIRSIIPEHFLLVPGVGAQGGSLEEVSKFGMNHDCGLLVNASRAIIFASSGIDFAKQATIVSEGYRNEMSGYLR